MSSVSRRKILQSLSGLVVAGALGPVIAQAAQAAPTLTGGDLDVMRNRWVDSLSSRHLIPDSPGAYADAIAVLDSNVSARLAAVAPTSSQFFSDRNWSMQATADANSNAMRNNYVDLQMMAVAWVTPGSAHQGSASLLNTVKQGLEHMYASVYHPQTQWWGNWWSWLIGATRPLADIMAILRAELDQAAIDKYCAAMDHFLPDRDPRLQIHPNGVQPSDGANRVDVCQAFIVRSIVQPDTALLAASVSALTPTWEYVTEGNGFFADGSFIQHSTIAYTGTYGLVLLGGLSKLFALLAGTAFDITATSRSNLTSAIEGSFAPLMYNGQMMDAVRGRAVSRYAERSIDNGNQLIEYTLRLADAVESSAPATATRWRGLCRQWIDSNTAASVFDPTHAATGLTDIGRLALVTDLMARDVTAVADAPGPRMFPAMDRLVHRGKDNSWALCLAMCSNRIAWHEGTAAENFQGVKTSQGMTYLYLPNDDNHFDDHFWATADLTAPPGTTVDLTPLPPNPEGTWGGATPQNEWTGGVTFGNVGVAGMHLVGPGGTGLRARKAWFAFTHMVVALGSDVSTAGEGEVRTVVEHRNLGTAQRTLLVDDTPVTGERQVSGAHWAHLESVGGYVFLGKAPRLVAGVATRTGTWRGNSTNADPGTDVTRERTYATLAYAHGAGAAAAGTGYAYAVYPGATPARTRAYAQNPSVEVLRNDATAQGVRHATITAGVFWGAERVGMLQAEGPMCLVASTSPASTRVSVSDPTQAQSSLHFQLHGVRATTVTGADANRVGMVRNDAGVRLSVDVAGTAGRTLQFWLHQTD
ncbi:polysaccharide lyase 8 family protein [Streptomyces sp. YPW6]|uniref:polysaccharide lyase 8 family protein n=1 Tax=Streptomyces sp. YPW6 TaxID=2840373 RepID=UPI003EBB0B55